MPWLALPFDGAIRQQVAQAINAPKMMPGMVVLDLQTGETLLNGDARAVLQ